MTIEKQKTELVKLLVSVYKAQRARGVFLIGADGDFERLVISQSVLLKYGFNVKEDDFWDIICPLLKEGGFLKQLPDKYFIGLEDRLFEKNVTYRKLKEDWRELDSQLPPNYSFAKAVTGKTTEEFLSSVVMLGSEKEKVRKIEDQIKKIQQTLKKIEDQAKQDYVFTVDSKKLMLFDTGEVFKLKPEIYGMGADLKLLWKKIKDWFRKILKFEKS